MKAHATPGGILSLPDECNDRGIKKLQLAQATLTANGSPRILLGSNGTHSMLEPLRAHGYDVTMDDLSRPSAAHARVALQAVDIVLFELSFSGREVLATIRDLCAVIGLCDVAPRLLCFSTSHRNAQFAMEIEKCGARYRRISDLSMLIEALELLLAEMDSLRKNGPSFHILHRFSLGGCAPGEEIAAILLPSADLNPQLPLALSERCIFNLLASHRRLGLDSRQIEATVKGDWFYREHAVNGGVLQRVKVRAPTVKVLIGRIRNAMGLKFTEAHLPINPFDVLESIPALGSNRTLYRLNADVRVLHETG